MATPFPLPAVTAAQIGTYFVGQYYKFLQQQPDYVHRFYTDASTMVRIDGSTIETASAMLQINSLIMSLSFTGVEIKTAHSLESWSGGVLVMVSGSVQTKNNNAWRKFMQTIFLAPQENGFFVLNDIFHFVEEEPVHRHAAVSLAQSNLDSKFTASVTISEPVSNYMMGGEIQTREFVAPADVKENGHVDKYGFPEQRLQHVPQTENILDEDSAAGSTDLLQNTNDNVQDSPPAPVDEPQGEPQKHTYASILRVVKGQSAPSVAPPPASNQNTSPASEWHHTPQPTAQQSPSTAFERSGTETVEEISVIEDEGELKSVYVRNLSYNVSPSEIEEQFKRFGKVKPDGVVIRGRKDIGVCYAFVEFEDIAGVQNAITASSVEIAGRQVYIEERRANSNNPSRGGRRGRGRGSYPIEGVRGRFGARYGRGNGQDGSDREYRPRGNGVYRQVPRQDRYVSRNGHSSSEPTA